jgi:microcystin-dependent protein
MPILNGRTTLTTILLGSVIPPGSVTSFAGPTAPAGWLLCDGSAVSRTTYADLFAAIGTTYGIGDDFTTFNLPDTRGRVQVGKDDMGGPPANRITVAGSGINGTVLGEAGGAQTHTLITAELSVHTHIQNSHVHNLPTSTGTSSTSYTLTDSSFNQSVRNTTPDVDVYATTATNQNTGSGSAHQNTQPSIIFNHIIKY